MYYYFVRLQCKNIHRHKNKYQHNLTIKEAGKSTRFSAEQSFRYTRLFCLPTFITV